MVHIKKKYNKRICIAVKCEKCDGWEAKRDIISFKTIYAEEYEKDGCIMVFCPVCRSIQKFKIIGVVETIENIIPMSWEDAVKFDDDIDYKACVDICRQMSELNGRFKCKENEPHFMMIRMLINLKDKATKLFHKEK